MTSEQQFNDWLFLREGALLTHFDTGKECGLPLVISNGMRYSRGYGYWDTCPLKRALGAHACCNILAVLQRWHLTRNILELILPGGAVLKELGFGKRRGK